MNKVNDPAAACYSTPQINALKKKLKASIERENDVEVLLQYESLMCAKTKQKYDDVYFAKLEGATGVQKGSLMPCGFTEEELDKVIRYSERSGVVEEEEINAFFSRWGARVGARLCQRKTV